MAIEDDIQNMFTSEEIGWINRGLRERLVELEERRKATAARWGKKEDWVAAGWRPDYGPTSIVVAEAERLQALMERFGSAPKGGLP